MEKPEKISKSLSLKLAILIKKKRKLNVKISGISKILIIRLNNIGDALITTPLLGELKKIDGVTIDVLCSKRNKFVFERNELCNKVYIYDKSVKTFLRIIKEINSQNYDCIIDSHDDVSSTASLFIAFSDCRFKAALEKSNSALFTHTIQRPDATKYHPVERVIEISKLFGLNPDLGNANIIYKPSADNVSIAENFLMRNFREKKFTIAINLFAGSDARFWGKENFNKLVVFLKQYNTNVFFISTESKLAQANNISDNIPVFSGSLDSVAAVISLSALLITPDTSLVHIASASETPVFGLFVHYNTDEVIWSPYKSRFDCVITKEPTLENISFEQVSQKLSAFIKSLLQQN